MPFLRERLASPGAVLVAGAHSSLSGRLVAEAGFDGIWLSGFELSALHGVPDASILTMDETVAAARAIAQAVDLPVLVDCDSGFGNAVNVIRAVRELEAGGAAGLCIEDNPFPKRCSFYESVRRELVPIEEHAGKIRAAVATRRHPDFVVIARTEALIAGWGIAEALRRAHAYADAGADLLLVHSKARTFDELAAFAARWTRPVPLVAVPTMYGDVSAEDLARAGFKVVIYANHALRSSIKAMRETLAVLRSARRAAAVDDRCVSVAEVNALVGLGDLQLQEQAFLPPPPERTRAVVYARGTSGRAAASPEVAASRLVAGRSVLEWQLEILNGAGIRDVVVVKGGDDRVPSLPGVTVVDVDEARATSEVEALLAAGEHPHGRTLVVRGDILFEPILLERLLASRGEVVTAVDRAEPGPGAGPVTRVRTARLAEASAPLVAADGLPVVEVGPDLASGEGELVGLTLLSPAALGKVAPLARSRPLATTADLLNELIATRVAVVALEIHQGWMEADGQERRHRACRRGPWATAEATIAGEETAAR